MRIIISIVFGLLFIALGLIAAQVPLKTLLTLRPFGLVCFVTIGLTLWQVSWNRVSSAYISALQGQEVSNPPFLVVGRNLLLSGILGGLIGLVHTTKNLSDSDRIGHPIYFSIASISYALLGYLFLVLCFNAATEKVNTDRNENNQKRNTILKNIFFALLMSFSITLIDAPRGDVLHLTPFFILLSCITPVVIAGGKLSRKNANYISDAIIVAGAFSFCVGILSAAAHLSDVSKAIAGMHTSILSILYAFIASIGYKWLVKQSNTEQGNEKDLNTKALLRFAGVSVGIVSLMGMFVTFHMLFKN